MTHLRHGLVWLALVSAILFPVPAQALPPLAAPCGQPGQVVACRHFGDSETRQLQFSSIAFNTVEDAEAYAVEANTIRSQNWLVVYPELYFGDQQYFYASNKPENVKYNPVQVLFVAQNTVNAWLLSGEHDDPFGVLFNIYSLMPNTVPVGTSPAEQAISMLPSEELVGSFGIYDGREKLPDPSAQPQVLPTATSAPRPTPVSRPTPTSSVSNVPAGTDRQTIEIMNNLEKYWNTRVTIRGEVAIIDKVDDQTVFVLTDEETYFFTVVYDGELPNVGPGDIVVVTGILLEQTVQGTPLVKASTVRKP